MAKRKAKQSSPETAEVVSGGETWLRPVSISNIGTVSGPANPLHVAAFDLATKNLPNFDRSKYLK